MRNQNCIKATNKVSLCDYPLLHAKKNTMKNLYAIYISISLLILIGCQDNDSGRTPFILAGSEYQSFEVICDRDTVLISKEGIRVKIEANTFDCTKSRMIQLSFAAALTKADMIRNKLYTIDDKGNFLESGGMFQLQDKTNNTETFKKLIEIEIPTNTANSMMSKYIAQEENGVLVWKNTESAIELANTQNLQNGKALFMQYCTSCHNPTLRYDMTGPALGNVHLFRDSTWLLEFTRNSVDLIEAGDTLALCLLSAWSHAHMTSFEQLSDQEIKNIYEFIANESRVQGIAEEEVKYLTTCDNVGQIRSELRNPILTNSTNSYQYITILSDRNWVNIDHLLFTEDANQIDPIVLKLDKPYEQMNIVMVFEDRNIVIPFVPTAENQEVYKLFYSESKSKINFPLGEKVDIVAYNAGADFEYTILKDYQPNKTDNNLTLSLNKKGKTKFLKAIEGL